MKQLICALTPFEVKVIKVMSMTMYKKLLNDKTENDENRDARYGLFDLYAKMSDAEEYMAKCGDTDVES